MEYDRDVIEDAEYFVDGLNGIQCDTHKQGIYIISRLVAELIETRKQYADAVQEIMELVS